MVDNLSNAMEQIQFQTKRLLLRAAEPSDYLPLFTIFSDPEVMTYWSTLPHKDPCETRTWLYSMLDSRYNGATDFLVIDRTTDIPIGKIGVWNKEGEIGFALARSHWRRGLMAEAMDVLLPYALETLGHERVIADVDPRNVASLALLAKFGFVETGRRERTVQVGENWCDSVDLELTREKWMIRKGELLHQDGPNLDSASIAMKKA